MQSQFELTIKDLFELDGNTRVLVGPHHGDLMAGRYTQCTLWAGNTRIGTVTLEGPMLGGSHPQGYIAVSTKDQLPFNKLDLADGVCRTIKESTAG